MRLMKTLLLASALLGLTQSALASCKRTSEEPTVVNVNFDNIRVSPDLPRGSVIGSAFVQRLERKLFYTGCPKGQNVKLVGKYEPAGLIAQSFNTYPTGVDGVGIRVALYRNQTPMYFGDGNLLHNYAPVYTGVGDIWGISLNDYSIRVELVKTKDTIDSGKLSQLSGTSGLLYLADRMKDGPIVKVRIGGVGSTVVINPSCTLESNNRRDLTVEMRTVPLRSFTGIGSTAGDTDVDFKLRCKGGHDNYTVQVKTQFTPGADGAADSVKGVLNNGAEGKMVADGVGIQVLMRGTPVNFEQKYNVGEGRLGGREVVILIPLTARYYQYGKTPGAGKVHAYMVYDVFYE